jgi:transposase-like protein
MPAPHPVEFRQRAVELARTGDKPIAQLAKELQISESCLRKLDGPGRRRRRRARLFRPGLSARVLRSAVSPATS